MARVMVVENDARFGEILRSTLASRSAEASLFGDGLEALEAAQAAPPDLFLICVELPQRNGYWLCNQIKKDPDLKAIPVILMSAQATPEDFEKHRLLTIRADEYLLKPFDMGQLLQKIGGLLGTSANELESEDIELYDGLVLDSGESFDEDEVRTDLTTDVGSEGSIVTGTPVQELTLGEEGGATIDREIDLATDEAFAALQVRFGGKETEVRDARITGAPLHRSPTNPGVGAVAAVRRAAERMPLSESGQEEDNLMEKIDPAVDASESPVADSSPRTAESGSVALPNVAAAAGSWPGSAEGAARSTTAPRRSHRPSGDYSRERESLSLRETINHKEKEILDLKEDLDKKERQILDQKDKVRELERRAREMDDRLLTFERELVGTREELSSVVDEKGSLEQRERETNEALDATRQKLQQLEETTQDRQHKAEQRISQLAQELGQAQQEAERARTQIERMGLEHTERNDETRIRHEQQLLDFHRAAAEEQERLRAAHEQEMTKQAVVNEQIITDLRRQLETEKRDHEQALQELTAQSKAHAEELHQLTDDHETALDEERNAAQAKLAALEQQRQEERQRLEEQHAQSFAQTQRMHEEQVARLRHEAMERERYLERLNQDESTALESKHRDEMAAATAQARATKEQLESVIAQQATSINGLETNLGMMRESVAERQRQIHEYDEQLTAMQAQLNRLQQQVESDGQMGEKAKRALAVAIALLDQQGCNPAKPNGGDQTSAGGEEPPVERSALRER